MRGDIRPRRDFEAGSEAKRDFHTERRVKKVLEFYQGCEGPFTKQLISNPQCGVAAATAHYDTGPSGNDRGVPRARL